MFIIHLRFQDQSANSGQAEQCQVFVPVDHKRHWGQLSSGAKPPMSAYQSCQEDEATSLDMALNHKGLECGFK